VAIQAAALARTGQVLEEMSNRYSVLFASAVPQFQAQLALVARAVAPSSVAIQAAALARTGQVLEEMSNRYSVLFASAVPQIQAQLAALAATLPTEAAGDALTDHEKGISLTRDQRRFLFGWYIYCVVQSLFLLAVLSVMGTNETDSAILGLILSTTGLSGHPIAVKARDAAWQAFDRMYPPEHF
jgi:hypothetical protein